MVLKNCDSHREAVIECMIRDRLQCLEGTPGGVDSRLKPLAYVVNLPPEKITFEFIMRHKSLLCVFYHSNGFL